MKSNSANKLVRVRKAMDMLSNCFPVTVTAGKLSEEFGVSDRTAWRDVKEARDNFQAAMLQSDREHFIPLAIAQAERHYLRCVQKGDLGTGFKVLQWIAELQGFRPTPLIQNTVSAQADRVQVNVAHMSREEIRARIEELAPKLGYKRIEPGEGD